MEKRILLAFFSSFEASKLEVMLSMVEPFEVDNAMDYDVALNFYEKNHYDFVIIDHKTKNGNLLIDDILTKNTQQKIILLSDTLKCPISCEECTKNFKFSRLVKPIDYEHLAASLSHKEFYCANKNIYSNVDTIEQLSGLLYLKDYLVYNQKNIKNNKLILSSSENVYNSNYLYREYELIKESIDNGFFKMKLLYDYTIEIEQI